MFERQPPGRLGRPGGSDRTPSLCQARGGIGVDEEVSEVDVVLTYGW